MRAWRVHEHGGPEKLVLDSSVPKPEPGPGQVRVLVRAVGLNHLDVWVRKGVPGHKFPLPLTPGCDIAGEIDGTGEPVLLNPGLSCGHCEACLGGFDPLCRSFGIFGETQDGGLAEYVIAPLANVIPRPPGLDAVTAAALPINFVTAWTMLGPRKANIQPGEWVLIQAGGSAVSVAAIQIAKLRGAMVVTTVGTSEKAHKALALGADHAILYREKDFVAESKKILAGAGRKGFDVVVDHVGQETFDGSLRVLNWGGRYVTCGATSGGDVKLNLRALFFKNISLLGSTMGSKADLLKIVDLVQQGRLKAIVDSQFPFAQTPAAFARIEAREAFGKVVVTV